MNLKTEAATLLLLLPFMLTQSQISMVSYHDHNYYNYGTDETENNHDHDDGAFLL